MPGVELNLDLSGLEKTINDMLKRANDACSAGMNRATKLTADEAKMRAPYKTGDLEKAIIYSVERTGDGWVGTVYLDDLPRRPDNTKSVREYGPIMETQLEPAGELRLGPGSRDKNARHGLVGGYFMYRALFDPSQFLIDELANKIMGGLD